MVRKMKKVRKKIKEKEKPEKLEQEKPKSFFAKLKGLFRL